MNDEVKEAVSACRNAGHLGNVKIQFRNTVVDAYLAELDETPPSPELLNPLGFVEKDGEWSIRIPSVRMVLSWSPVDATLKEPGDFPMPHTMGQIRTLLRVFGVSKGEKK